MGFSIGESIVRLHLQGFKVVHSMDYVSGNRSQVDARRTRRMAVAEKAGMAHTVLAARRHRLEMTTWFVEPPIDYLESVLSILQESRIMCLTL
jgi:hypothetical protein